MMEPTRCVTYGGMRLIDEEKQIIYEFDIKLPEKSHMTEWYFTHGGSLVISFVTNQYMG